MTHTEGPWSEPGTYGVTRFEVTAHSKRVAVIDRIEDARLVSSAPELLTALDGLLDCITDPRIETLGINHNMPIERARAAIAKATGGHHA